VTVTLDLPVPARVLAVGAHPDDIEFGCGATLAKWAAAGAEITLAIATDGSKGTWDPGADLAALVATRAAEQQAAADVLGAKRVEFLGAIDGELEPTPALVAALCATIRRLEPDVMLSHDPWQEYRIHPDHHAIGMLTLGAIVAARDPHFYPDQPYAPHRPSTLLLFEPQRVQHVEDVDGWVDHKVDALLAHTSQYESTMAIHERPDEQRSTFARGLHDEARAHGIRVGRRAAEAFARIDEL
jgi:LmbE family N-acetylglucosaminyl deacetylase